MTSVLQVVDSLGWIEVLTNEPQADRFLEVLDDEKSLVVSSIAMLSSFVKTTDQQSRSDEWEESSATGVVPQRFKIGRARIHLARSV